MDNMGAELWDLSPADVTDFVKQDRTPMPALLTRLNLLAK